MKLVLASTPNRETPTTFPPFACLGLMKVIRQEGLAEVQFHHLDGNRPPYAEAIARICTERPQVLGISAVVSTSYAFVKQFSLDIKRALPETLIIQGGNMGASAEIILRKTGVDLCALGEGEIILVNVMRRAAVTLNPFDYADIPGLVFLDQAGKVVNTGYEAQLSPEKMCDFDWQDLEKNGDINHYIFDAFHDGECDIAWFQYDARTSQVHRKEKKVAILQSSKGCVNRCTFCHRWMKGIRNLPLSILIPRIEELKHRYNVGFINFGDENFGSNRNWLIELCAYLKEADILWVNDGMRVHPLNPDILRTMYDAGCTSVSFGIESGSDAILEIMEKKANTAQSLQSLRWCHDVGIHQGLNMVLGMPGESPQTIAETIDFLCQATTMGKDINPHNLSLNYAQALPGTPLYEFGRHNGLIGKTIDEEEQYLLDISDKDAVDRFSTINFTNYPRIVWQGWSPLIRFSVNEHYARIFGIEHYQRVTAQNVKWLDRSHWIAKGFFSSEPNMDGATLRVPSLSALLLHGDFELALLI